MKPRIEYDPHKDAVNRRKHKLALSEAELFDWAGAINGPAHSGREFAIGQYKGRLHIVIFKKLGTEAYSIISFRRADKKEQEAYNDRQQS